MVAFPLFLEEPEAQRWMERGAGLVTNARSFGIVEEGGLKLE